MNTITPTATEQVEKISIINLIQRLAGQLDDLNIKRKELKLQIDDMLMNYDSYQVVHENAKEAAKIKKQHKEQLINDDSDLRLLVEKHDDLKEDITMVKESLDSHLQTYVQITGTSTFEDVSGTERKIKIKMSVAPGQMRMF